MKKSKVSTVSATSVGRVPVVVPNNAVFETSERAEILGHSVETNLRHYTFAKPDYLRRVKEALG